MGSFSIESDAVNVGRIQALSEEGNSISTRTWDFHALKKPAVWNYSTTAINGYGIENRISTNGERKAAHIEGIVCDGEIDLEPVLKKLN
jgi:hypothetical protein